MQVTTDQAKCYPPALRIVLPHVKHRTSKYLTNSLERDHGHLKQRLHSMDGFKQAASADLLARGHAFVQDLRDGSARWAPALMASVPRQLRLLTTWSELTQVI